MELSEILEEWSRDSILSQDALDSESIKIPNLHAKYLRWLSGFRTRLKAERLILSQLKHDLGQYYRGELNNAEDLRRIRRDPWVKKIHRPDTGDYVAADAEVIAANQRIIILEEKVEVCSAILDQLVKRTFIIKNAVDFLRLMSGA